MLRTVRVLGAFALVTAGAVAASCGGDESATTTDNGTGGKAAASSTVSSTAGTGGSGGAPITCDAGEGTTLALTSLDFGPGNSGEWKKIGLNVDGLVSTAGSTDVCQPNSGGSASTAYPDGENGIDNSFGKNLLPIILSVYPLWPDDVNNFLTVGEFNALLKMYCLPPTGDVGAMTTKLFGGTKLGSTPKYDGTDMWPVAPELLADPGDPESSTITFPQSSVTGNAFDTGKNQKVIFTIPMNYMGKSTSIKLTLYGAQLKFNLSADRKSATGGVVGGALDTEEFLDQIQKLRWLFDQCDQAVFDNVILAVRQSSDIMSDGTQDPAQTCNGISIGIAFELKEVQIGTVGPPAEIGMTCP